eukprot:1418671-Pyramimonas_sp.AAC.1
MTRRRVMLRSLGIMRMRKKTDEGKHDAPDTGEPDKPPPTFSSPSPSQEAKSNARATVHGRAALAMGPTTRATK